jgi:hypothetical protein
MSKADKRENIIMVNSNDLLADARLNYARCIAQIASEPLTFEKGAHISMEGNHSPLTSY